jgi:hypothetical protein
MGAHQPSGVLRLGRVVEAAHEPFDAPLAVPAHDRGRDLVADRVPEHRRVPLALADALAHAALDVLGPPLVIEERDVLLPGESDHDQKPMPLGSVEDTARRDGVRAERVEAVRGHRGEVPVDRGAIRVVASVGARPERPIGHSSDIELLFTAGEELASRAWPRRWGRRQRLAARSRVVVQQRLGHLALSG